MPIKSVMLRFDKFIHETPKAYLIRIGSEETWLPKKLCRNMITNKKLGGNVSIPTFLYEKITGIPAQEIPTMDADYIVEKHIPNKLEPINTNPDATLIR